MPHADADRPGSRSLLGHLFRVTRCALGRLVSLPSETDETAAAWTVAHSEWDETRWVRGGETVSCFRFDDGYVATVTYDAHDVTWQLTPGPTPLGTALAAVSLYLEHAVTPQLDRSARTFVAVDDEGNPRQVFEEIADQPVEYVYLERYRDPDEYPEFISRRDDVDEAFDRMSTSKPQAFD